MTLTTYKSKKTKVTLLLSSQYQIVTISGNRKIKHKKILAYNSGKFGVDCVDQMTKHHIHMYLKLAHDDCLSLY